MMTTLATLLFTAMLATALLSLAWDLTRNLMDPEADGAWAGARAEAARIAALPRARQPLRVIVGNGQLAKGPSAVSTPLRRPQRPALAAAA